MEDFNLDEFIEDAIKSFEGVYGADDITLYFILFGVVSLAFIVANRRYNRVIEGGFNKSLNFASIMGYVLLTNIALFYLMAMIIVDFNIQINSIVIIGYVIAYLIQITLILFMVAFIVFSAYYFVFVFSIFKR